MIKKYLGFILCTLVLTSSLVHAEDIRVTSTFNKKTARVGEEIRLTIRVTGATATVPAPRLPSYPDFDSFYTGRASHMSFINGKSSSSTEFSYVLVGRKAGRFTLDPIQMIIDNRTFKTDAIQLTVEEAPAGSQPTYAQNPFTAPVQSSPSGSQAPPPYQAPAPGRAVADDNIFIAATVDKTVAYPNEQILLTYTIYTRYDTRSVGFEEEPQVSGFWIEDFPMPKQTAQENVRINGKRYIKAELRKIALFPTEPADYTIQPGKIKASIRKEPQSTSVFDEFFNDDFFSGGNFFARRENRILIPEPINIKVQPFPETRQPESFDGTVGSFQMQATVDRTQVKQNEPVTMTIVIAGQGNIETLNKPSIPDLPAFKIYETDTKSEISKAGGVIGGKKTFEISFIPTEAGNMNIPPLSFSFFNPRIGTYETLRTPSFPLQVEAVEDDFQLPSSTISQDIFKKNIETEGRDIVFIEEKWPDVSKKKMFSQTLFIFVWANILLVFSLIYAFIRAKRNKLFQTNHALKRKWHAKSHASSRIKPLQKLMRSEKPEDVSQYFDEVEKTLTKYLSDKFNFSTHGSTRASIKENLEARIGPDSDVYQDILELYQICDEARFARAEVPQAFKEKALETLKAAMSHVERVKVKT